MSNPAVAQNYTDLYHRFGNPADPDFETRWMTSFHETLADGTLVTVHCHKAMAPSLKAIWDAQRQYIHTYDGCYNNRLVRGGTHLSLHAWGLAVDLNASQFPLGSTARQVHPLTQAFLDAGYWYGGDFHHRPDPMHFQWAVDM